MQQVPLKLLSKTVLLDLDKITIFLIKVQNRQKPSDFDCNISQTLPSATEDDRYAHWDYSRGLRQFVVLLSLLSNYHVRH